MHSDFSLNPKKRRSKVYVHQTKKRLIRNHEILIQMIIQRNAHRKTGQRSTFPNWNHCLSSMPDTEVLRRSVGILCSYSAAPVRGCTFTRNKVVSNLPGMLLCLLLYSMYIFCTPSEATILFQGNNFLDEIKHYRRRPLSCRL